MFRLLTTSRQLIQPSFSSSPALPARKKESPWARQTITRLLGCYRGITRQLKKEGRGNVQKNIHWRFLILMALFKGFIPSTATAQEADAFPRDISEIRVRDPFILTDTQNGRYIMI